MKKYLLILLAAISTLTVFGAEKKMPKPWRGENYDESKVPQYTLPSPLSTLDGKFTASSAFEWSQKVRPQLLDFFQSELYGYLPPRPAEMRFELREQGDAFDGKAIRKQIRIHLKDKGGSHFIDLLVYIPKNAKKPVPVFHGLNFCGNHTVVDDNAVFLTEAWIRNTSYPTLKITDHKAYDDQRGKMSVRWNIKKILESGYAFSTAHYGDIYPDMEKSDSYSDSIYKIFSAESGFSKGPATIAWAWGNARIIDCLETLPEIDKSKIAVTGHSRLGRTAILIGALDERVALTLGNNPGCMGTALSRRRYGERMDLITSLFPFWFSPKISKYLNKENDMPVDQHTLVACIAPRLVYVASAEQDYWGDPKGELLGLIEAQSAYKLFGAKQFPTLDNLVLEKPFYGDAMGFHLRDGKHNMTYYDWDCYLEFAKRHGW